MSYSNYKNHLQKIADVAYSIAVLSWDQETYMPEKGAELRAQQISTLSGIHHKLYTDKELELLLEKLINDNSLNEKQKKNVLLTKETFDKQKKYSTEFVELMSKTIS
ncbi:MAG: carboxypeptidase M32, partial [Candidatus Fonsibacter sp.]